MDALSLAVPAPWPPDRHSAALALRLRSARPAESRSVGSRETSRLFPLPRSAPCSPWPGVEGQRYLLSTLTVDSEVSWALAGITYSMVKQRPCSSPARQEPLSLGALRRACRQATHVPLTENQSSPWGWSSPSAEQTAPRGVRTEREGEGDARLTGQLNQPWGSAGDGIPARRPSHSLGPSELGFAAGTFKQHQQVLLESLTPCVFTPELDLSAWGPVPGWWPTVDRGGHTHPDITSSPEKHQSCVKSDWQGCVGCLALGDGIHCGWHVAGSGAPVWS